jgi:hypothetical protein
MFFRGGNLERNKKIQFFNKHPITLIFHFDKNASPFEIVEVAISQFKHMILLALVILFGK